MNNIYHHPTFLPLKINTFQKTLLLCTTQVPFYNPHGNIQLDGIAMGSVFRPIFSNFYMSVLENKVFNTIKEPKIYLRYADETLLLANSTDEINTMQETFQNNSVLNFTQEINIKNKIPFLGVLIETNNNSRFIISTYKKNYFQSECPFRYKRTIIKTSLYDLCFKFPAEIPI